MASVETSPSPAQKIKTHIALIGTLLIGIVATITTEVVVDKLLKDNLVRRAESIAVFINTQQVKDLSGDESDLAKSSYTQIKNDLVEFHKLNKDSRFAYLMKKTSQGAIFLADSEHPDSPDYSPPGQVYDEISEQFNTAFDTGKSGWEIAGDRWGTWITGYAALYDHDSEKPIAIIGIDLDYYENYLLPIIVYSSLPAFFFVIIFMSILYSRKVEAVKQKTIEEKEQLMRIATHEIRTPMTEIYLAAESLLENTAISEDSDAVSLSQQLYLSAVTMVRRVTNLLKVIELTVPKKKVLEKVEITSLLKESIENSQKIAKILSIHIDLDEKLPNQVYVPGEKEQLKLLFSNLIAHSFFYTKKTKSVVIDYKESSQYHEFCFTSKGDILSLGEVNNLFSAYYKGEPMSGHTDSTGLGLYLVKKIITLYGGSVTAFSNEAGVTICLSLLKK